MSILIKGMKMPEHCGYCRFAYDGICHALQVTRYDKKTKDGKLIDCPLVEIPTPHSRLIDINDVVSAKRPTDREPEKNEAMALYKAGWDAAIEAIIENAPTIIEAEGNNDEWAV